MKRNANQPTGKTIVFNICQPDLTSLKNHKPIQIGYGTEISIDEVRNQTTGKKRRSMQCFMLLFPGAKPSQKSTLVPIGYDNPTFTSIVAFVKDVVPVIPPEFRECKMEILKKAIDAKKKGCQTAFKSELTFAFTNERYFIPADGGNVTHVGCDDEGKMYVKTANNNQYFISNIAAEQKAA